MKVYNLCIEFTDGSHADYTNPSIKVVDLKGHKFLRITMHNEGVVLNYSMVTINGFSYDAPKHGRKFLRINGHC